MEQEWFFNLLVINYLPFQFFQRFSHEVHKPLVVYNTNFLSSNLRMCSYFKNLNNLPSMFIVVKIFLLHVYKLHLQIYKILIIFPFNIYKYSQYENDHMMFFVNLNDFYSFMILKLYPKIKKMIFKTTTFPSFLQPKPFKTMGAWNYIMCNLTPSESMVMLTPSHFSMFLFL